MASVTRLESWGSLPVLAYLPGGEPELIRGGTKVLGNQRAPAPPHWAFQASACLAAAQVPLAKARHRVSGEELPKGVALGKRHSSEAVSAATCHKLPKM